MVFILGLCHEEYMAPLYTLQSECREMPKQQWNYVKRQNKCSKVGRVPISTPTSEKHHQRKGGSNGQQHI